MNRTLAITIAAALAAPAWADNSVVLDLAGVRIADGHDEHRDSAPDTIDAAAQYDYLIDGMVHGVGGIMGVMFSDPTPLADVLETFSPGSSEVLSGRVCNAGGDLPAELYAQQFSGQQNILGIDVTFAMTASGGLDAQGVMWFSLTDVVLTPAFLVGSLEFTSGSVTVTVFACDADFNADCTINSQDFIAFLNAFVGLDPRADYNGDGAIDSQDFIAFLNDFVSGC